MPFLIEDIRHHTLKEGGKYLFDANVWLAVLDTYFSTLYSLPYVNLFNDIIAKKKVRSAVIVVPALLLSEILNRYIHDIYYKEFQIKNPVIAGQSKSTHYKKVYRSSPEYARDLEMACQEIRSYAPTAALFTDDMGLITLPQILTGIPTSLDFNDHIYARIAKEQKLLIVTGDADFCVEGVHILTTHPRLLKLMKK